MELQDIQTIYDGGNTEFEALMQNGEKQSFRLFVSSNGTLAYFAKGKHTRGYPVYGIVDSMVSVKIKNKKITSLYDGYILSLRKFKKAYTESLHKNLWGDLRAGYEGLNISEFEKFVVEYIGDKETDYDLYKILCKFCQSKGININTENRYKTTTIKSNAPKQTWGEDYYRYNQCLQNIKNHLDNKENFSYYWESNYDVSVTGKVCEDGIYRAWFSLEFRGCGNGHYYLLVNENQAVFCADD
jgi:hypothetical protein